jgi:hypothetical protein
MLILLHHLTLSYRWNQHLYDYFLNFSNRLWYSLFPFDGCFRWQVVGNGDGIQYCPFPVPKHGLLINIITRNKIPSWSDSFQCSIDNMFWQCSQSNASLSS